MIIVDRRGPAERLLDRQRDDQPPGLVGRLAGSFADRLVAGRVARRGPPPDDLLVVSVGNLRVGGTGKTPVVCQLASDLAAAGIAGGVITRGYRAADATPRLVAADDARAGDEARLLAGRLAGVGWSVIQAARREIGLDLLRRQAPGARVALLEDAHQTAGIGRHADILILDRWHADDDGLRPAGGAVMPLGPYRETARGAGRADIWLVESDEELPARGVTGTPLAGFARRPRLESANHLLRPGRRVGLVSGLARPRGFEATGARLLPAAPVLSLRLPDHCAYGEKELGRIATLADTHGLDAWLTTEKDLVKLGGRWPLRCPPAWVRLDVVWTTTPTLSELVEERLRRLAAGRRTDGG
jgi:tetraacyldisaccharide 4'-kinase